jgi:hypothetical protein
MIKISHRGNIKGPHKEYENNPIYVSESLKLGYDVEIDVWLLEGGLFLGHDIAEYKIDFNFLQNTKLWCHCKNIEALHFLLHNNIRCFFHDSDKATLTSDGYIWTYPGNKLTDRSICVMPEKDNWNLSKNIAGVCSDFVSDIEGYIK